MTRNLLIISKVAVTFFVSTLLTACINISTFGPATTATVTITDPKTGEIIFQETTSDTSGMAALFGEDWKSFSTFQQLGLTGNIYPPTGMLKPKKFYRVESVGGIDIDADNDGVEDEMGTPIAQSVLAFLSTGDIKKGRAVANAWTTPAVLIHDRIRPNSFSLAVYNFAFRLLIREDVDGDGLITYRDGQAFTWANDGDFSDVPESQEISQEQIEVYRRIRRELFIDDLYSLEDDILDLLDAGKSAPFSTESLVTISPGTIICSNGAQIPFPGEVEIFKMQTDGVNYFRLNEPDIGAPSDVTISERMPTYGRESTNGEIRFMFRSSYKFESSQIRGGFESSMELSTWERATKSKPATGRGIFAISRFEFPVGGGEQVECNMETPVEISAM